MRPAVRAPAPHESGPLAGIDLTALRALLTNGSDAKYGGTGEAMLNGSNISPTAPASDVPALGNWALRGSKKIYVGNLPEDTKEEQVSDFFNRALRASKGASSETEDPIVSVYLNLDKRFAFIETKTVSEAAACIQLDGVLFQTMIQTSNLRIRRPNDYPSATLNAKPPPGFDPTILGIVGTQVTDGPNKLFIGGIPYHLTEDQVKDLLSTYGRLTAFNLVKETSTGLSKGYAFCEYSDPAVIDSACSGLNGMQVDDKTLTVRKASTYPPGADPFSLFAGGATSKVGNQVGNSTLLGTSTRVLELRNVIVEEELVDDEEYQEIAEEMQDEGKKYGELEHVHLPRPKDGEERTQAEARGVGRVFLKYATIEECERAQATLSGRKFDQRIVRAAFFDEAKFEKRDFS